MATPDTRLDREFWARGFVRAAQYFANMLASADVLAESRELIRSIFAPDTVCFCQRSQEGDRDLPGPGCEALRRTIDQVIETSFMAMENLGGPSPRAWVVLPVSVRGRTEAALLVAYAGEQALPTHALEALLGVVGLIGATLARQRADRELMVLAEERAARAIAEVTEKRARLLSEVSKALSASFDHEATLAAVARLLVPQLADGCAVELREEDRPSSSRRIAAAGVDLSNAEPALVVPMAARGEVLGTIALGASSGRAFGTEDRALAEEIGRRAGTAIENARLYRQAQEAIGVREQFLAIASHELKTPLFALMLVIQGVERSLDKLPNAPERMRSKIAVLSRQGQRLNHLVMNLLDVARIQAGRLHVSIEPVDLCAVVREVVERHEQEASVAGCAVEIVAGEPVTGAWDPSRVDQVVSNLLSNAIKYGAGKPVSIVAEADGDRARLSITDRGIGIAPADQERIFQRFERAVSHRAVAGMGLGLWITREIVTRLEGSIRVESQLGEGARFTVELPLRPPLMAGS